MAQTPQSIAIICSCLEPARSGVGDYARVLAEEARQRGVNVVLVALHDEYANQISKTEDELRIPANLSWKHKVEPVRQWLGKHRCKWASVQWVSYGWEKRGLAWEACQHLPKMLEGHRINIIVHETWLGEKLKAPFKECAIGALQRWIMQYGLTQLNPSFIHTTNSIYQHSLRKVGFTAKILPMFSTLKLTQGVDEQALARVIGFNTEQRNKLCVLGVFGTLHPVWEAEPFMTRWLNVVSKMDKEPVIVGMGNLHTGQNLWNILKEKYSQIRWFNLGMQNEAELDALLQSVDFGLATTPWQLLGKSTSALAFLERGVSLLVTRDEPYEIEPELLHPLVIKLDGDFEKKLLCAQKQLPSYQHRAQVVGQWLEDIT